MHECMLQALAPSGCAYLISSDIAALSSSLAEESLPVADPRLADTCISKLCRRAAM